jgi:UDP-N-acetylglucosamine 1-carboxyvinyltransferase
MGCNISFTGNRKIRIIGVKKFKPLDHKIIFDRIELGTYIIAGALAGNRINILKIQPTIIQTELRLLKKNGSEDESRKKQDNCF